MKKGELIKSLESIAETADKQRDGAYPAEVDAMEALDLVARMARLLAQDYRDAMKVNGLRIPKVRNTKKGK